jgi:hypothetical protein
MIKHIVMWKMKAHAEGADAASNMKIMRARLSALRAIIPEIADYSCGPDFVHSPASYDFAIVCTVKDRHDLQVYNDHPEHVKVKQFIAKVTEARVLVDLEGV